MNLNKQALYANKQLITIIMHFDKHKPTNVGQIALERQAGQFISGAVV